jgi:NADH:ubiquinone oxidoreductase subunit 2 (subunit N)
MWLLDVYEGVPTVVTMIFAILPKIAMIGLFIYISIKIFVTSFFFLTTINFVYSACIVTYRYFWSAVSSKN